MNEEFVKDFPMAVEGNGVQNNQIAINNEFIEKEKNYNSGNSVEEIEKVEEEEDNENETDSEETLNHSNGESKYNENECDITNGSEKKDDSVSKSFLDNLDLDVPSSYQVEPVDFPKSPWITANKDLQKHPLSDEEEDKSMYQAQLLSNCQDVRLLKDETVVGNEKKKKLIPVCNDIFNDTYCDESSLDGSHTSIDEADMDGYLDSPDELNDSILERLGKEVEPIPTLSVEEERLESQIWKSCVIGDVERKIDLKVLEPYKKVIAHGGYLSQESHKAIIVFSSCYLPDRTRVDYDYVMSNLFMYVIHTLDQLVTEDYVIVYLHGATSRNSMPKFKWLRQCYQMIDRKLRKNLKALYLVHPTFWLKTLVVMIKPFISSKFGKKIFFMNSLSDLSKIVPLDETLIPERVKKRFDRFYHFWYHRWSTGLYPSESLTHYKQVLHLA